MLYIKCNNKTFETLVKAMEYNFNNYLPEWCGASENHGLCKLAILAQ